MLGWDNQEKKVIIDDYDSKSYEFAHPLESWSDNYDVTGEKKGGAVNLH